MDSNKLSVLREIGYTVNPSCGSCVFADLNGGQGTCRLFKYGHLKRQLSIRRDGLCDSFVVNTSINLGSWNEFRKEG